MHILETEVKQEPKFWGWVLSAPPIFLISSNQVRKEHKESRSPTSDRAGSAKGQHSYFPAPKEKLKQKRGRETGKGKLAWPVYHTDTKAPCLVY